MLANRARPRRPLTEQHWTKTKTRTKTKWWPLAAATVTTWSALGLRKPRRGSAAERRGVGARVGLARGAGGPTAGPGDTAGAGAAGAASAVRTVHLDSAPDDLTGGRSTGEDDDEDSAPGERKERAAARFRHGRHPIRGRVGGGESILSGAGGPVKLDFQHAIDRPGRTIGFSPETSPSGGGGRGRRIPGRARAAPGRRTDRSRGSPPPRARRWPRCS